MLNKILLVFAVIGVLAIIKIVLGFGMIAVLTALVGISGYFYAKKLFSKGSGS